MVTVHFRPAKESFFFFFSKKIDWEDLSSLHPYSSQKVLDKTDTLLGAWRLWGQNPFKNLNQLHSCSELLLRVYRTFVYAPMPAYKTPPSHRKVWNSPESWRWEERDPERLFCSLTDKLTRGGGGLRVYTYFPKNKEENQKKKKKYKD